AIHAGKYSGLFWFGALLAGHAVPLLLILLAVDEVLPVAALLTLIGLYCYEHAFVMAPQEVPNS
ncbi:MAG: 4Fe-4S ferredoxin, partial [Myxococcota bacterium]|nr:4Fe-4S ferredoxin [Myxococcota bacterium]